MNPNYLTLSNEFYQQNEPCSPCLSKCTEKTDTTMELQDRTSSGLKTNEPKMVIWEPIWEPLKNFQGLSGNILFHSICIFCKKITDPSNIEDLLKSEDPYGRFYLCHHSCLAKQEITKFPLLTNLIESFSFKDPFPNFDDLIGAAQYCCQMKVWHPVSHLRLFESLQILKNINGTFTCELGNEESQTEQLFTPRAIIPSSTFRIEVDLKPLNQQEPTNGEKIMLDICINTKGGKRQKIQAYIDSFQMFELQCEVLKEEEEKKQALRNMKWRFPLRILEGIELIKINRFRVSQVSRINENFEELDPPFDCSIIEYIKTLNGSKEYQKYYESMKEQQKYFFLHNIYSFVPELIQDEYANYLMQKICETNNLQIRQLFLQSISHLLSELVCCNYGTFVFQSLLSNTCCSLEFNVLCEKIAGRVNQLAVHPNGTHFIRKLVEMVPEDNLVKITYELLEHFLDLSLNKNSLCVMKIFLRRVSHPKILQMIPVKEILLQKIEENFEMLLCSEFGNYLIQELFLHFQYQQVKEFHLFIGRNFFRIACAKYSSIIAAKMISQFWKNNKLLFDLVAQQMDFKKLQMLQTDRQGKKVFKQIVSCSDFAAMKLRKMADEMGVKGKGGSFHKNKWASKKG